MSECFFKHNVHIEQTVDNFKLRDENLSILKCIKRDKREGGGRERDFTQCFYHALPFLKLSTKHNHFPSVLATILSLHV